MMNGGGGVCGEGGGPTTDGSGGIWEEGGDGQRMMRLRWPGDEDETISWDIVSAADIWEEKSMNVSDDS